MDSFASFIRACWQYLIRGNPDNMGWKPYSTRPLAFLTVFAFVCILITLLQMLRGVNDAQNGLAFAPIDGSFSTGDSFLYLYFPTIVSVSLSIFWSWVDLDVKRMEPFYQMSSRDGANAVNSLLLKYPFEFLPLAPVSALRRRHVSVILSSTVTVLIFWIVTPLQGAMLSTSVVNRTVSATGMQSARLTDLRQENSTLNYKFLEDVWDILWFGMSLPRYTTKTGIILPFDIPGLDSQTFMDLTVYLDTTYLFSTMTYTDIDLSRGGVWATDRGCTVNGTNFQNAFKVQDSYRLAATAYNNGKYVLDAWEMEDLKPIMGLGSGDDECIHEFLSFWANNQTTATGNSGMFFAHPEYWTQEVRATLSYPNMTVLSIEPIRDPIKLDTLAFNSSSYEYLIGYGYQTNPEHKSPNASDSASLSTGERLLSLNVPVSVIRDDSVLMGIALSTNHRSNVSQLMNRENFKEALSTANSLTFALAARQMLASSSETGEHVKCSVSGSMQAIVMNQQVTLVVQVFLGLIAVMSVLLLIEVDMRPSKVSSNPDSLGAVAALAYSSGALIKAIDLMEDAAYRPKGKRKGIWRPYRWFIGKTDDVPHLPPQRYTLEEQSGCLAIQAQHLLKPLGARSTANLSDRKSQLPPSRPFYLDVPTGVIFTLILIGLLVILSRLQAQSLAENGLEPPQVSAVGQNIILKYLPVFFATFLEAFWVLLNRNLCVLQPFEELRSLKARPSRSILTRYSALPPQLVFARSLRARHWLLAILCAASFSSNILAVSLAGLFSQTQVAFQSTQLTTPTVAANYTESIALDRLYWSDSADLYTREFQDHFFIAQMYISKSGDLPAWTTPSLSFVPVALDGFQNATSSGVNFSTQGFSVISKCENLELTSNGGALNLSVWTDDSSSFDPGYEPTHLSMSLSSPAPIEMPGCQVREWHGILYVGNITSKINAAEFGQPLVNESANCPPLLLLSYMRNVSVPLTVDLPLERPLSLTQYMDSGSFLVCSIEIQEATYDVQSSMTGRILSYHNTTAPSSLDLTTHFNGNVSAYNQLLTAIIDLSTQMGGSLTAMPHTDEAARQWLPYLMAEMSGNMSTVDPKAPVPTTSQLSDLTSRTMSLLGSIVLSINRDVLFDPSPASAANSILMQQAVRRPRVFLDPVMLTISQVLLAFHIFVAVIFYIHTPKKLLPTMPTSLAVQLSLFAGSSLVEDDSKNGRENQGAGASALKFIEAKMGTERQNKDKIENTRREPVWNNEIRLGYGRFRGVDGVLRTGIERAELVSALPSKRFFSSLRQREEAAS